MAYQSGQPTASSRFSDSQSDIKDNFTEIKNLIDVNHETFGSSDEGKHKYVSFPVQGSSPSTTGSEVALFSRTSSLTSNPELAIRKDTDGAVYEFTSSTAATNGWTYLPSGILIKWGQATANASGSTTITFPTGASIAAFSNIYNIQTTATAASGNEYIVLINSISTTSFDVTTNSPSNISFYYYAIGD